MQKFFRSDILFYCFTLLVSVFYFLELRSVPFHPDESTQIYMSGDVELFLQSPSNLYWEPSPEDPLRQKYRELDAPITRSMIGIGRQLFGLGGLSSDWDWSKGWSENTENGALPDKSLLLYSRLFVAILFPASLVLIYSLGKHIANPTAGWIAAILFFCNPQILLHTRRAMAESALIFAVLLSIFAFLKFRKHPWLIAIPIALAFNAKQTAAGLILVGLLVAILSTWREKLTDIIGKVILFLMIFGSITFLLNPFMWSKPIQAVIAAVDARNDLLSAQTSTFALKSTEIVLDTMPKKTISIFVQIFFAPLQFAESANYLQNLSPAISNYQSNWLTQIFSARIFQVFILLFSFVGIIKSAILSMRKPHQYSSLLILLFTFIVMSISILISIPLSFQRYYLPLIPFLCLFSAYAITDLIKLRFPQIESPVNSIQNRN